MMDLLTHERLEEIRKTRSNNGVDADFRIQELLAHIDALQAEKNQVMQECISVNNGYNETRNERDRLQMENKRLAEYYRRIRGTDKDHQVHLEKLAFDLETERNQLREKLAIACKHWEMGIDLIHLFDFDEEEEKEERELLSKIRHVEHELLNKIRYEMEK